jgi:hypothetical protein
VIPRAHRWTHTVIPNPVAPFANGGEGSVFRRRVSRFAGTEDLLIGDPELVPLKIRTLHTVAAALPSQLENSLCPGQERRTMRETEAQTNHSGYLAGYLD